MSRLLALVLAFALALAPCARGGSVSHGAGSGLRIYSAWAAFTPTGNFLNTTYTGMVRQVGDTIDVQVNCAVTLAPAAAAALAIDPPTGFTVDTSKLAAEDMPIGWGLVTDSGVANRGICTARYNQAASTIGLVLETTATNTMTAVSDTSPVALALSDSVRLMFSLPVTNGSAGTVAHGIGSSLTTYAQWSGFTPTGAWTTAVTYTGMIRQVGDTIDVQVRLSFSGATDATSLTIDTPSGYTLDATKLVTGAMLGTGIVVNGGTDERGLLSITGTASPYNPSVVSTSPNTMAAVTRTVPLNAIGNTDSMQFVFRLPVSASPAATIALGCGAGLAYEPWAASSGQLTSWTTNPPTLTSSLGRRVGDTAYVQVAFTGSGAAGPGGTALNVTPYAGPYPVDTSKVLGVSAGSSDVVVPLGPGTMRDDSAASLRGPVNWRYASSTSLVARMVFTAPCTQGSPIPATPFAFTTSDTILGSFWIPIK